jgi:hypothetical protein
VVLVTELTSGGALITKGNTTLAAITFHFN